MLFAMTLVYFGNSNYGMSHQRNCIADCERIIIRRNGSAHLLCYSMISSGWGRCIMYGRSHILGLDGDWIIVVVVAKMMILFLIFQC